MPLPNLASLYPLTRSMLFAMDPEVAHERLLDLVASTQHHWGRMAYAQARLDDPLTLAGLHFPNRVGLAAGLDKNARCIDAFAAMGLQLDGVTVQSVSLPEELQKILDQKIGKGAGGEIQLTDGIEALMQYETVLAYRYHGRRFDCGSKLGYLQASVEIGLQHAETGAAFADWLAKRG